MATSRWLGLALAVGGLLGLSLPAAATTMVELTTEQLVDASDAVVHGTITEVWSEVDQRGWIWTRAQVEVEDVYKGDPDLLAVVVDQVGGTWAGRSMWVPGAAAFSAGEEVVLFLQTSPEHVSVVGMHQGKYTVRLDPYSRSLVVQRFTPDQPAGYDHRFLPLPDEQHRVYFDGFVERIRDRVEAGWDGQMVPGTNIERLERINGKEVR